jgi:hypothetical protein
MKKSTGLTTIFIFLMFLSLAQEPAYPQSYFRHPLNIPMELVANFGELRTNHWHMGLDIRTQQRENLPVYSAAEGYISRVSVAPGGFGRAIYINHPNGYTTLYAHLNNFEPGLHQYIKEQQYRLSSWQIDLELHPGQFPVQKGSFIAYSGNTGGSAGPHVHFEIRDTKTGKCLNPLLFKFPIADAVAPSISRLAMYNRNVSVYGQSPQVLALKKSGNAYTLAKSNTIISRSDRISFAITATDRFSRSANPNGIYSAQTFVDGKLVSGFILDNIDYNETRYMNAHIDYRHKANGGPWLQHISRMEGDTTDIYLPAGETGFRFTDQETHAVRIVVRDANKNQSVISFNVRYEPIEAAENEVPADRFLPGQVNIFERPGFQVFTTEYSLYDGVDPVYSQSDQIIPGAVSPVHTFLNAGIPVHDAITVRITPGRDIPEDLRERVVMKQISGTRTVIEKVSWQNGQATAKFRQFGSWQLFLDQIPPTINSIGTGDTVNLSKATRLVFTPKDNLNGIRSFKVHVNGQWLLFTNDKGRTWIYSFDQYFPKGVSELVVTAEDIAGNVAERRWHVRR